MRKALYLFCGIWLSNVSDVFALASNIDVGYNVPVVCSINGLPSTVNLSVLATQTGTYATNFQVVCNTNDVINLTLSSTNQSDGVARLTSSAGRYLNYQAIINNVTYVMGTSNQIAPNANNNLILNIDKPVYAGKYQDSLVFTISY